MRGKRAGFITLLCILFAVGFYLSFRYFQQFQRIKIGDREIRINLNAKIDPQKIYHLRLWDYDWPFLKCRYRQYLLGAIAEFRKTYPNIRVEIRLLDLLTGSQELSKALEAGRPPDLYCSAFDVPEFDFRYQIPVGPFTDRASAQPVYFAALTRLLAVKGVQCYFPRWARLPIWVGNRTLAQQAGLNLKRFQEEGWNWESVVQAGVKLPEDCYPVAGNPVPEAVAERLTLREDGPEWDVLERIKTGCRFPAGFDSDMIGHFMAGRALFIAGVQPVVFDKLRRIQQQQRCGWEAVCLPAPAWAAAHSAATVELGVISVYRQKHNGGNGRVVAAMKLAEFLSVYPVTSPWEELMVVPAARKVALTWSRNVSGVTGDISPVITTLDRIDGSGRIGDGESRTNLMKLLHRYLLGRVSLQQLKAEIGTTK
jgi:hypothetical protein